MKFTSLTLTPSPGESGKLITVSWTVADKGQGPTPPNETTWTDQVYLSANSGLDSSATLLGTITHNGILTAGGSYNQSANFPLANGMSGNYTIFVVTDANAKVYEGPNGPTNNTASAAFPVTLTPPPDLQVQEVTAPPTAIASQPITVSWTVTNAGSAARRSPTPWYDSVYLSRDQFLDAATAIYLGARRMSAELAAGESYHSSLTVSLPANVSGPYYVIVAADPQDAVYEGPSGHIDNTNYDPTNTLVTLEPPADLTVSSIAVPASGIAGEPPSTSISWTVRNTGGKTAHGLWSDAVYLSSNGLWSASDPLVATLLHVGDVAPGQSYTASTDLALPGVTPGNYYVIVRTDVLDAVPETDKTNNQATSASTIAMDIPALTTGVTASGTVANEQYVYYKVTVPAGETLDLTADFDESSEAEFYVRYGAIPSRDQYDQVFENISDLQQELTVPSTLLGTYYILLYGREGTLLSGSYSITAQGVSFGVSGASPSTAGNSGTTTVVINGAKFTSAAQVSLIGPGGLKYPAAKVSWINAQTLWASFDLSGVAPASYDIQVDQAGLSSTLASGFNVTNGGPGQLQVKLIAPGTVRPGASATLTVQLTNVGGSDIDLPPLTLTATNADLGNSGILGTSGILGPGQTFTAYISFTPTTLSGIINFQLKSPPPASAATAVDMGWGALEDQLRPTYTAPDAWDAIFSNFTTLVGSNLLDYENALDQASAYLSQLGEDVADPTSLTAYEFELADDTLPRPILTSATDTTSTEPGLSLTLTRNYLMSLDGRYALGPFGRGWDDPWDMSVSVDSAGVVDIETPGTNRFFYPQPGGGYTGSPGDHATLTEQYGAFELQESNGSITSFLSNGQLAYMQDSNGNRITAVYTGDLLTSLVDSSGDRLTFNYNAVGRIDQVVDPEGRVTTYDYDATGQYLLSVTGSGGTTSYTYSIPISGPAAYELLSVANSDGTHHFFTYDSLGRLTGESLDGDADAVTYTYLGVGEVQVTDATGDTTSYFFNDSDLVAQIQDPLGNDTQFQYDASNNLVDLVQSDGTSYSYTYDSEGNLTSEIDPLGHQIEMTYNSQNNQLSSITDARGNTTQYNTDSQGNLLSITYPDGTSQQFQYDPLGNLAETIDGNGNPTNYIYSKQGLVTEETFADGSALTYAYDSHQNLITATDSTGTTTLEYNSADELTKITYPTGMFLEFTYNSGGQRIQSVDQTGFTVNYAYDSAGRLAKLADGSGDLIVEYTYDADSRLLRKDMGNGTYTTYTYDADGNVLDLDNFSPSGSINSFFDYSYDQLGRAITETTSDGTWTYAYDAIGELTHAVFVSSKPSAAPDQDLQYNYDANGNRVSTVINGVSADYIVDSMNQYTSIGGETLSYDDDGNLVATNNQGVATTYRYNLQNRLVGVSDSSEVQSFTYDALGNLGSSTTDGVRTQYLVDPTGLGSILGSYDAGSGFSRIAHYVYGLGLASQVTPGNETTYYDFDASGSTTDLTGATGSSLEPRTLIYLSRTSVLSSSGSVSNPFKSFSLYNGFTLNESVEMFGFRAYQSSIGRFVSIDPAGRRWGVERTFTPTWRMIQQISLNSDWSGFDV